MDTTDEQLEPKKHNQEETNSNNSKGVEDLQPSSLLSYQNQRHNTTKSRAGRGSGRTPINNKKTLIGQTSTNTPTSAQAATNNGKPIFHMNENVYQVYLRIMTNNKNKPLSEIKIANVILKAIQQVDGKAEILTPRSNLNQRLSFTTINPTFGGDILQNRTFSKVFSTEKQNWYGNLWLLATSCFQLFGNIKASKLA